MVRYSFIVIFIFLFYCSGSEEKSELFLNNFSFSECKNNNLKKDEQNFEVKFLNDTLFIKHVDAVFNCCKDSIGLEYDLYSEKKINILNIYEIEYTDKPCRCNCPIDLEMKFVYLKINTTIINVFIKYYNSVDTILIYSDTLKF